MNQYTDSAPQSQQSNVNNWKEIDVSTREGLRELDKIIFQRLTPDTPFTFEHEVGGIYGDEIYAYRTGIDDLNDICWDSVPAYSMVADCALQLLNAIKTYHRLEICKLHNRDGYFVKLNAHIENTDEQAPYTRTFADSYVNVALGIAMCWLEYTDAEIALQQGGQS